VIFRPVLVDKILKGSKTVTRRPLKRYVPPVSPWIVTKGGERRRRPIPSTIEIGGVTFLRPYKVGKVLPIQKGRGKPAVTHVRITGLRTERVGAITHLDARAEGFRTTGEFKAYWTRLYDRAWVAAMELADPLDDIQLVARFDARHAATVVWVIAFETCEPPARYLAPTSGYTTVLAGSLTAQDTDKRAVLDTNDGAVVEDPNEPDGNERYLRNPPPRSATINRLRPASQGERDALLGRLRSSYHGWEPEDIVIDEPRYGTPGDVRQARREMGLRGTDGLDPIPPDELERVLAFMVFREASLREIMLAMDWSLGKTQRVLAARGRVEQLPAYLKPRDDGDGRRAAA
jgi:hypothetical protein